MLGFKQFTEQSNIKEASPLSIFKIKPDTKAKIRRKYVGIIKLIKQKYKFDSAEAVDMIIKILASGVDPDNIRKFFDKEIDRWYKGQDLNTPAFNL